MHRAKTARNYFELLHLSWECVLYLPKYGMTQPPQHEPKLPTDITKNYKMVVFGCYGVFAITHGIFLSNVCHLGLSKVIYYGVILSSMFYLLHTDAFIEDKIKY